MKSEGIFSWYDLVSFVNIAYKVRHTLENEILTDSLCCFEKVQQNNWLRYGRDKKHP